MSLFTHLHVHTQFSILDGASNISDLIKKVKDDNMTALAITDHGNMFGAKLFHDSAKKQGIKPIIGIEAYVARRGRKEKKEEIDKSGYHLIILAKNKTGYHNIIKLASLGYTEGMYYKPRIDRELLEKYKEGLIISSACLGGEVPQQIMKKNIKAAEEAISWYKKTFGEDYYLELQRHYTGNPEKDAKVYDYQVIVNEKILELAKKHQVKVIATNDCHFINKEDAEAHDLLICLNTGKDLNDPNRMSYTKQEYVKTQDEMKKLFSDLPEAIANTQEITDKVEEYELNSSPIMPDFKLPEGFTDEDNYLKHLTYKGAKERYKNITPETQERIDFELETIKKMGFPGYFLIVQDFINEARKMGVVVGPGRGSAAGSVVAYCTKITNIDPIKYDLLFERFLNPDRISMPDIDIDFDDDGRQEVLNWVVNTYGKKRVSHIVTFGTMAAKLAIRDIARVHKLPLPEADRLAKLVPEGPKVSLKKAFAEVPELEAEKKSEDKLIANTLKYAETLEGSVRQTGVHACGIIIGKNDLTEYIPVYKTKDVDLLITQYDGHFVESVGMLKMDFLGLKTLSIIKECIENVKHSKGHVIDIDKIPLDDKKTFELYSRGDTTAIFQFESPGMKKHLRNLKPNRFEDLVAMNALYRPGPMEYIPSFINRKHGNEEIEYDHPMMEPFLKDTYGITVYQEQVMLQSRALGGFTRGQSDSLRKAMGKKIDALMKELKVIFVEGCNKNEKFIEGCKQIKKKPNELINKIWKDWEAFAKYAFNKSHSVCYAYVSYQTAYLKAHYPAEFMAAVLSRNLSDIKKITIFMDECKRMGLEVLGPDVNESLHKFTVNKKGAIRFGMAGIKGIGEAAVQDIIDNRKEEHYKNIFDFVQKVNPSAVNKKAIEVLALSGGFDNFNEIKRNQFFEENASGENFISILNKFGQNYQNASASGPNLFGGNEDLEISLPEIPKSKEWSKTYKLNKEKELIGIFLSAHPLDEYKLMIERTCTKISDFNSNISKFKDKEVKIAGIVSAVEHRTTKTGKPFGSLSIEDYTDTYRIMMFSKDYLNFKEYFTEGYFLMVIGKVLPRYNNPNEFELKVNKIELLQDIKESVIKSIALKIEINELDEETIKKLHLMSQKHKGKTTLRFIVWDSQTKVWIDLYSKSNKVEVSHEFIQEIEDFDIPYKIY